jgi:DNA modification methylase
MNTLYYGDNLEILRKYVRDESVDLIYLDPPFNSQRAYNVIFQDKTGKAAASQIQAFEDTWIWGDETQSAFDEIMRGKYPIELKDMMKAFKEFMGTSNLMAYLTMMAIRLVELRRVLKDTGSLYLHCDPTASHYLKILLDQIFNITNFRNEIIWQRVHTVKGNFGQGQKAWGTNTDSILFYTKNDSFIFNVAYREYSEEYLRKFYRYVEPGTGRRYRLISMIGPGGAAKGNAKYEFLGVTRFWRYSKENMQELMQKGMIVQTKPGNVPQRKFYLDIGSGVSIQNLWDDIEGLGATDKERLGYPTQKPQALLERIIQASSNEGDVVLDPFCGCGTAVVAAEKLNRKWIGIDVTYLAIWLIKNRMKEHFPDSKFEVIGEPKSVEDAKTLFASSPFKFESWAVTLIGGQPFKSSGGGDTGIDGLLYFQDNEKKFHRIIIEVKGGGYHPKDVRALKAVIDREEAPLGVLLALEKPTKGMLSEAAALGKWTMPGSNRKCPVLQIITIEDIFSGKRPDIPDTSETLKKAEREKRPKQQGRLL